MKKYFLYFFFLLLNQCQTLDTKTGCFQSKHPGFTGTIVIPNKSLIFDLEAVWSDNYNQLSIKLLDPVGSPSVPFSFSSYLNLTPKDLRHFFCSYPGEEEWEYTVPLSFSSLISPLTLLSPTRYQIVRLYDKTQLKELKVFSGSQLIFYLNILDFT